MVHPKMTTPHRSYIDAGTAASYFIFKIKNSTPIEQGTLVGKFLIIEPHDLSFLFDPRMNNVLHVRCILYILIVHVR